MQSVHLLSKHKCICKFSIDKHLLSPLLMLIVHRQIWHDNTHPCCLHPWLTPLSPVQTLTMTVTFPHTLDILHYSDNPVITRREWGRDLNVSNPTICHFQAILSSYWLIMNALLGGGGKFKCNTTISSQALCPMTHTIWTFYQSILSMQFASLLESTPWSFNPMNICWFDATKLVKLALCQQNL